MRSNKIHKVERDGEVQPDRKDKGSDARMRRDKYLIEPDVVSDLTTRPQVAR